MKRPLSIFTPLGHQKMEVRVKIYLLSEGLDGGPAEFPQKPTLVAEEDAQYLRHGENNLAVGNIQEKLLPHPLTPFLPPFRMARWAKSTSATGKVKEPLLTTVRTPDASKAAVEVALDHILDDGSEEAVLFLET